MEIPNSTGIVDGIIAEFVRSIRIEKGLSQEQLASDADLHRTYVSLVECNKRHPTVSVLIRLGYALDLSPEELFKKLSRYLVDKNSADSLESNSLGEV